MSRKSFALLLVLVVTSIAGASAQNLLNYPTCSVYDPVRDCYYVTNQASSASVDIVKIDSLHVQSAFVSSMITRCTGLLIKGDTLYTETQTTVVLFDLNTRAMLTQIPIPGASRLYAIEGDDSGNLYLSDFEVHKIFKLHIGTWEVSTFATGLTKACGMLFQRSHNRLIVVSGAEVAIISAVDMVDSSVTQLVPVGLGDLDRLAEDDEGNIYVSDWTNDWIYQFDPELTTPLVAITGLRDPAGMCFDIRRKIMLIPQQTSKSVVFREVEIGHFNRVWAGPLVEDGSSSDARGAAWVDYDNDGHDDLFVTNAGSSPGLDNRLFHNNANGTFSRITDLDLVGDGGVSQSSTWADYDNDGAIDCFVANAENQSNFLYHNTGSGSFTRVNLDPFTTGSGYSTAAAWSDYDKDGRVDIFLARRTTNSLFHNTGSGFVDVTTGGMASESGLASGAAWGDYDGDLDPDLFVPFETGGSEDPNDCFYENTIGSLSQVAKPPLDTDGGSTYGGSWGDFDNDGDLDLFVPASTNGSDGGDFLYRNNGDGSFTLEPSSTIATSGGNSFSSCWADLNNDSRLDLFVANTSSGSGPVGNFLFWNNGNGTFTRDTVGQIVTDTAFCTSVATSDYDRDGDLDLYVTQSGGRNSMLYRNNVKMGSWIELKCVGRHSNTSAIGARIKIKATIEGSPVWQMREISAQTGFGAQSSLTVHFGLQDATTIDTIMIQWPSGLVSVLKNVTTNQYLIVYEQCCQGRVGDANGVGGDEPTIGDVSTLIDALYISGNPGVIACLAEADVNQSGETQPVAADITIGDVSALIDYLFLSGASVGLLKCL